MEPVSPTPTDPLVGTRVGSYVIDRLLGQGGMGSVYVGVQPEIGKRVAVKFLADEFNANASLVQRFFQEARAVNVIGHENIVDIFDFGKTPDGRNYFVMELLEGKSLEQILAEERALGTARVVDASRQMARCLGAAHERGIVHRDLKPDNVFLVRRGGNNHFVKVLDFGIAKLTGGQSAEGGRTQTGMVLGTPGYMAPEQGGGSVVDLRADVYALGVMMYRMLAGKMPFPGEYYAQILRRQLMEEASSLRAVRADVDARLDGLVLGMLAREPGDRPQTMREVEEQLAEVARGKLSDSVIWYTAPVAVDDRAADVDAVSAPSPGSTITRAATDTAVAGSSLDPVDHGTTGAPRRSLRRGNGGVLIAAGLGVILLGAVVAVDVARRGNGANTALVAASASAAPLAPSPNPSAAPQVAANAVSAAAPPAAAPAPSAPPPPASFTVHVASEPAGAAILDGQKKLGVTPADLVLDKERSLVFRLAGYRDEKVEARSGVAPPRVVLKKIARATGATPSELPRLPRTKPGAVEKSEKADEPSTPTPHKGHGISLDD